MEAKEEIISEFFSAHNIGTSEHFIEDHDGVYWLATIKLSIDEDLRTRGAQLLEEEEPTWAITRSMLDRVYEQLAGGFICLFTGAWASVEVVCRATLEAAINVLFVLESDTAKRLSQYMTHYFEESLKSIDRYEGLVTKMAGQNNAQLKSAVDARNSIAWRRKIIEGIFQHEHIPCGLQGWPKTIMERFKAAGREFEYREIYANLSSQVHNDADALVDFMILTVAEHIPNASEKVESEVLFWLRHFLYCSLEFYSEAAKVYTSKYGLENGAVKINQARLSIGDRLKQLSKEYSQLKGELSNS